MLKKSLSWLLVFCLVFPSFSVRSFAKAGETEAESVSVLPEQEYEEGEVIVSVKGGEGALYEALSGGLLGAPGEETTSDFIVGEVLASFTAEEGEPAVFREEEIEVEMVEPLFGSAAEEARPASDGAEILLLYADDVEKTISRLSKLPCVEYAQPNYIFYPEAISGAEEPFYPFQWGLSNQDGGYDIGAEKAWTGTENLTGEPIVVAVMDSGVDYTHPDLAPVMWDDGLSYPELTALGGGAFGLNTSGDGPTDDPMDRAAGHGTHCASIIASAWNEEETAGINGGAEIMALYWLGPQGGSNANYIKAANYVLTAKKAGVNVRIANNSWGITGKFSSISPAVSDMVGRLSDAGIISVFASGNSTVNIDGFPAMSLAPSDLFVSVDAADSAGRKAGFSNYGKIMTDVFAPGVNILAAATTSPDVISMPPQYLPWLDNTDTVFYCDMEQESLPVSAAQWREGNPSPAAATPSTASPSVAKRAHRGTEDNHVLAFDAELGQQEEFTFDLSIELTPEEKEELISEEEFYLAFEIDRDGMVFTSDAAPFSVSLWNRQTGEFLKNEGMTGAVFMDSGWNYATARLKMPGAEELFGEGNVIRIRLSTVCRLEKAGTETVYLDNLGIGTAPCKYTYSNGTSMACPAAAGVLSLIVEKLSEEAAGTGKTEQEIAREAIALLKGGVEKRDGLSEYCITSGLISAANSLSGNVSPVVNQMTENADGTVTLSGYFFGTEEGTVTANGTSLIIRSWSDREIVTDNPGGTRQLTEFLVTASSGKWGRNFFETGTADATSYRELPAPPFASSWNRMAGTNGTILLFSDTGTDNAEPDLTVWKYDIKEQTFGQVPIPGNGIRTRFGLPYETQAVAGETEIYFLSGVYELSEKGEILNSAGRLLTYDTGTDAWKYDVTVDLPGCFAGSLCICDGELLLLGREEVPSVYRIYPDTGEWNEVHQEMPAEVLAGNSFEVNGEILVSGAVNGLKYLILDSLFPGFAMFKELERYEKKSETWAKSATPFIGPSSAYLDAETSRQSAAVPLVDGLLIIGPVSGNGEKGIADTWRYDMAGDTYEKYPAVFDTVRTRHAAACLVDGVAYVLGVTGNGNAGKIMKFASLELGDLAHNGYPDVKKSGKEPDPKPDPKPYPKPDPYPSPVRLYDGRPLRTGTYGNPVTDGTWYRNQDGIWFYCTNAYFKNTWGYIVNPYAVEGQHKADWFWFDSSGHMLTGWQLIGGKWYYLNPLSDGTLGACFLGPGLTPDGYEVDESGAWTGKAE